MIYCNNNINQITIKERYQLTIKNEADINFTFNFIFPKFLGSLK